jgi:hypothetical protein
MARCDVLTDDEIFYLERHDEETDPPLFRAP